MSRPTERARQVLVVALLLVWLVVPPLLMAAQWPQWWAWIAREQSPMTWLQSVVLVLAAVGSLLIGHVLSLTTAARRTACYALGVGFGALAVDERFALHERVRDSVLAPRGVSVPFLPWVAPGDFLVLTMALAGLALLPSVWRVIRDDDGARAGLVLGMVLAAVAVGGDSIDPSKWSVRAARVQQTAEEVVELGGGLALLASVGLRLLGLLGSVFQPEPAGNSSLTQTSGEAQRDCCARPVI